VLLDGSEGDHQHGRVSDLGEPVASQVSEGEAHGHANDRLATSSAIRASPKSAASTEDFPRNGPSGCASRVSACSSSLRVTPTARGEWPSPTSSMSVTMPS